jgi:hypothetical protein
VSVAPHNVSVLRLNTLMLGVQVRSSRGTVNLIRALYTMSDITTPLPPRSIDLSLVADVTWISCEWLKGLDVLRKLGLFETTSQLSAFKTNVTTSAYIMYVYSRRRIQNSLTILYLQLQYVLRCPHTHYRQRGASPALQPPTPPVQDTHRATYQAPNSQLGEIRTASTFLPFHNPPSRSLPSTSSIQAPTQSAGTKDK